MSLLSQPMAPHPAFKVDAKEALMLTQQALYSLSHVPKLHTSDNFETGKWLGHSTLECLTYRKLFLPTHSKILISPHLEWSLLYGEGQTIWITETHMKLRATPRLSSAPWKPLCYGGFLILGFCFHFPISGLQSDSRRVWWQGQMTVTTPSFRCLTMPFSPQSVHSSYSSQTADWQPSPVPKHRQDLS